MKRYETLEAARLAAASKSTRSGYQQDSVYSVTIPHSMLKWLLMAAEGHIPPDEEVAQLLKDEFMLVPARKKTDLVSFFNSLNEKNRKMNWHLYIRFTEKAGSFIVLVSGMDMTLNRFEALLISRYMMNWDPCFRLAGMLAMPSSIQIKFEKGTREEALERIKSEFHMQELDA